MSSYSANFLNWEISKHGILHEKKPQYPVYSLPFKGESSYNKTHSEKQFKELIKHVRLL
jgi:hypothetical protein